MFGEMQVIDEHSLQKFLDLGYEFVSIINESQVIEYNTSEDAPPQPSISIGTTYPQNNYQSQQRLHKTIPVVVNRVRYLMRRTVAAKTLFESKQNENK